MTAEKQRSEENKDDEVVAAEWAKEIEAQFNKGDNRLSSIKVCINPKYRRTNIYVEYEDVTKSRPSGSEDTVTGLCEALIKWPDADSSENNDASFRRAKNPTDYFVVFRRPEVLYQKRKSTYRQALGFLEI